MNLKTAPTPADFSIVFPLRGTYKPTLKAGIVVSNAKEMMFAMGQEFGEVFDTKRGEIAEKIFAILSRYIETAEQENQQPVTGIRLSTRNNVIQEGIPEALVDIWLYGGHGSPSERVHLLPSDEYGPPLIGAIAHDFPDAPRALVSSTTHNGDGELIPLTEYHTAQPLGPDEQIPSHIEHPIREKIRWSKGTRIVYPVPVLNEEKLRHPDVENIILHSITQDVRNRLTGTELFFQRFLRDEEAAQAALQAVAVRQVA
ncbi:MAG: hypothetical protein WC604_00285 [Candidatus Gracilibacteria bacterium]